MKLRGCFSKKGTSPKNQDIISINRKTAELLKNINWFSHCGTEEMLEIRQAYRFVSDHREMLRRIAETEWENYTLEQENELTSYLSNHHRDAYRFWNQHCMTVKEKIFPDLFEYIKEQYQQYFPDMEQVVLDDLQWNILGIFLADAYSEYYRSAFSEDLLTIYRSGHIPCGISDENGDTILMIY